MVYLYFVVNVMFRMFSNFRQMKLEPEEKEARVDNDGGQQEIDSGESG